MASVLLPRSTSIKLLLLLTLALLPLGIVALLASLQANRDGAAAQRADLRVATSEAGRKLSNELIADMIVLAAVARAAAQDQSAASACDRATAVFAARPRRPARFALYGTLPEPICSLGRPIPARPSVDSLDPRPVLRVVGDEAELSVPLPASSIVAVARYPMTTLAAFARPAGYNATYRLALEADGAMIELFNDLAPATLRTDTETEPLGFPAASLTMTVDHAPLGALEFLITFLPLLMWASAAIVGFVVVDRVLVGPLKRLRGDIANLVPGAPMPSAIGATPAVEIDDVRRAFAGFADRLAAREQDLENALTEQVALTREVHHRVKNNLQVIASLISLHARGTTDLAVTGAYTTIQRRVDALAIVHRNLFAELEAHRGINVRSMLGELASNFRANGEGTESMPPIAVTAVALSVGQDIAMPLAFMFTELAELSVLSAPQAPITVAVTAEGGRGSLTIASAGLQALPDGSSYAMRIVEGLSRQLRAPLEHDPVSGRFTITFPVVE